jgi:drug/metabolite transporter (DMT)-like permease
MTFAAALPTPPARADRGAGLGLLAVALFALTTPMTRLAVGADGAPALSPLFVTAGRAAAAGLLAAAYLAATGARRPVRADAPALAVCALGTVLGFPLFLALALRSVDAVHAAVVTGVIPIATAAVAALVFRRRPSAGFWAAALAGTALVLGHAAWRGAGAVGAGDLLLLGAVASAAFGYVAGTALSARMPPSHAVSWVLVLALPATLPVALAAWPAEPVGARAWGGFAYVSLVSMWLAFFAWYAALARGDAVRTSQVQLVQPFITMLFAVPLLGETLDAATLAVALAVAGTVLAGRRFATGRRP